MITQDVINESTQKAEDFLRQILTQAGREASFESKWDEEAGSLKVVITGDNLSDFIGEDGKVIDSLQYLTTLVVNKKRDDFVRILLDIDGYREKRKQELIKLAIEKAELVKAEGSPVSLPAMSPYERRVIHMTLQDDDCIETESQGKDPDRYLVIKPAEE